MENPPLKGLFQGPIGPSCLFFKQMRCLKNNNVDDNDITLDMLDEDSMRCVALDCLVALQRVRTEKKFQIISHTDKQHEETKNRVFTEAISSIMDNERLVNAKPALHSLLTTFPDKNKMTDNRTWLPLHFAMALGHRIKEDDVRLLYSRHQVALQQYHRKKLQDNNNDGAGFLPVHLLCMQTQPNMSLMRYLSMRDSKAFTMEVRSGESYVGGRNALQLAAEHSESVELIKNLMQIDQSMAEKAEAYTFDRSLTALGFLCGRSHFTSFNEMFECLIAANSSIGVVGDGLISSFIFYGRSCCADSQVQVVLAQVESLLKANSGFKSGYDDIGIFHLACHLLEGKLGIAILSLLLTVYSDGVGSGLKLLDEDECLPIHYAARYSTVDVVELLLEAYPESRYETDRGGINLLHHALSDGRQDRATANAKVQYLCDHCPDLLQKAGGHNNKAPLFYCLATTGIQFDLKTIMILCEADNSIVKEKCQSLKHNQMLPLHALICLKKNIFTSGVTFEADCFRYLLHLYPAAAGIKDGRDKSPYDRAIAKKLNVYFIRLLLNADPTIDPKKHHDLNYAARKEAMFLAYRALTSSQEASIWVKLRSLYERRQLPVLLMFVITYL